ncbi:D-alanyl-D-alanine carboxypeptidase, partial [Microbacteriaceae bacterium K1510]|nr:D-alanyl-D-alanine carboxypeptidase [Microbacteriaceae bacterium K1510]
VKEADSFYGEMLVKALGAEEGLPGTTEQGVTRIQTWLKALGANPAFDMIDGSGLTRYNLISANQLVSVLELMAKQDEDHFRHYLGTFPVAGVDRMLSERLKGTAAANNVRAISGNVTGVSSLTGYVTTKEGERLAFSILMNGYAADTSELLRVQ